MRAVVQRVSEARVSVDSVTVGEIGAGLCVLLGVGKQDSDIDADFLAEKIKNLRIFEDDQGKMNRSVVEASARRPHGLARGRVDARGIGRRTRAGDAHDE